MSRLFSNIFTCRIVSHNQHHVLIPTFFSLYQLYIRICFHDVSHTSIICIYIYIFDKQDVPFVATITILLICLCSEII